VTTGSNLPGVTIARSGYDPDVSDEELLSGRYALGPVIGRGSSALVRRGVDRFTGEAVAVKLFSAGASTLDERRRRQELAALGAVDHPGLVRLRAGGTTEDHPYVVMDLVDGPTLAERLLEGPLPADEVRVLGARLADALAHVHALGFVHRDVKPANVLLGDGSCPRLADFGIARALDDTSATATGFVVGTAAFLAPEQVRGEPVGPRADVFALGLVLLEALNGKREYPGSAVESATARLHRSPRVPDTPLGDVIAAMTTSEARDRLDAAGAAAALTALPDSLDAVGGIGDDDPTDDLSVRGPARRWARRLAIPVAATLLVGGGVAGSVGLLGGTASGSLTASTTGAVTPVPAADVLSDAPAVAGPAAPSSTPGPVGGPPAGSDPTVTVDSLDTVGAESGADDGGAAEDDGGSASDDPGAGAPPAGAPAAAGGPPPAAPAGGGPPAGTPGGGDDDDDDDDDGPGNGNGNANGHAKRGGGSDD
jgi:eukaryotic-like serine/threonine-protein kinase